MGRNTLYVLLQNKPDPPFHPVIAPGQTPAKPFKRPSEAICEKNPEKVKICFFSLVLFPFFFFFKDRIGREEELRQVPEGSHIRFKLKIKLTRLKAGKAHLICQMVAGGASFYS